LAVGKLIFDRKRRNTARIADRDELTSVFILFIKVTNTSERIIFLIKSLMALFFSIVTIFALSLGSYYSFVYLETDLYNLRTNFNNGNQGFGLILKLKSRIDNSMWF